MMNEFKELLNNLCGEFGINNEVVIKVSQYLDKLILEEQKDMLKKIK